LPKIQIRKPYRFFLGWGEGDEMRVNFGKYKGLNVDEIPSDYLKWLTLQDWCEEKFSHLLKEAEEELAFRATWDRHFYQE